MIEAERDENTEHRVGSLICDRLSTPSKSLPLIGFGVFAKRGIMSAAESVRKRQEARRAIVVLIFSFVELLHDNLLDRAQPGLGYLFLKSGRVELSSAVGESGGSHCRLFRCSKRALRLSLIAP